MNCIICKKEISENSDNSYFEIPTYHCKNCKLFVTGNDENELRKKIEKLYQGDYWTERESEKSINSYFSDEISQGKYRNWLSQFLYCKPFIQNKKSILELGVGGGQASFWFDQKGYDITGIEPDERNVRLINKKLKRGKIIHGFIEDINLEQKFDVIWMSHVLEHLIRPDIFLKKININLKQEGVFFIEVPSSEHGPTLNSSIYKNPHVYHFTKESLQKLVKENYKIVSCDCFRPATKFEGGLNKFLKKSNMFPFYPRIKTSCDKGRDLRIILQKKV